MEIVRSARQGNEAAFMTLFREYRPLVYSLQKKYYLRDYDEDDWMQEAMIIFYQSLKSFDETKGTTIGALFKRAFENRIRSLIRKQCAYKRKAYLNAVSLEEKVEQEGPDFLADHRQQTEHSFQMIVLQEVFADYEQHFSKLEGKVLKSYLQGKELTQIAEEQSIDYRKIRSAYDRAKRKITSYIGEMN